MQIASALPGIAAILAGITVFFLLFAFVIPPRKENAHVVLTDSEVSDKTTVFHKYIRPALRNFLPQSPFTASLKKSTRSKLEELLIRSGNPWGITPEELAGTQVMMGFVLLAVGIVLAMFNVVPYIPWYIYVPAMTLLGYLFPYSYHNTLRENRLKGVLRQLPEALDLLVISISSGKGFESAFRSVTPKIPDGILKDEFQQSVLSLDAGRSMTKVLEDFSERAASDEVGAFARAVIQSQKLGSDISETLTLQAQTVRRALENRVEKKISRLRTNIFIPLMFTMLPSMLIIFLAPYLTQLQGSLF